MGCTACTEPQCLYKGDLYLYLFVLTSNPTCALAFDMSYVRFYGEPDDDSDTKHVAVSVICE